MNIYTGMLFQQGFIQDAQLALSLSGASHASLPSTRDASRSSAASFASQVCKPFKRGAIAAVCSIALSPFR